MATPAATALAATRRRWLVAGVAAAATATGATLAWMQRSSRADADPSAPLWDMEFDTLGPQKLAMRQFAGRPLILNFWATWCPPCIEEFPLLDAFYRQNSPNGWQVVGLAVDQATAVEKFLQQNPVQFSIALAGIQGMELSRSLGNLAGGLPFTVAFNAKLQPMQRKMGRLSLQDLQTWAAIP